MTLAGARDGRLRPLVSSIARAPARRPAIIAAAMRSCSRDRIAALGREAHCVFDVPLLAMRVDPA